MCLIFYTSLNLPSFLSLENHLSDSYTFIRTLTRLTKYMYYSRLLVYDIVNLVTVALLNVLITVIRFVLEPIGFACITAPIHLSSYCNQYNTKRLLADA